MKKVMITLGLLMTLLAGNISLVAGDKCCGCCKDDNAACCKDGCADCACCK